MIEIPSIIGNNNIKIFPLAEGKKTPIVKWNSNENFQITDFKTSNYAIDTGRSNLVVIDCDTKNGIDGVNKFLSILEEHDMVNTLTVSTPNKGMHFYFKIPENVELKTSAGTVFGKGIDIRASGGYVVGPGSSLIINDKKVFYEIDSDTENIAMCPEWLLNLLIKKADGLDNFSRKNSKNNNDSNENSNLLETNETSLIEKKNTLNWAINKMLEAKTGNRNDILNKLSFRLGCKRLAENEALDLVNAAIKIGLEREEAEKTFYSGYKAGLKEPESDFEQIIKEYNKSIGINTKDDPLDSSYYTHHALSEKFYIENVNHFIYWAVDSNWYQYEKEKGRWVQIKEQVVMESVNIFLDRLVNSLRSKDLKFSSQIYKIQEKLWLKSYVESVTVLCRNRFMVHKNNLFDQDPYLINCKNGIIDLANDKILEHDSVYYITHYIPIEYDPDAKDEYFNKIIESIHPEERNYMQLIAGQSLVAEQPVSQRVFFLHGRGSNGKSTFVDLMLKTSGSYGKLQSPSVFVGDKNGGDKYALADFEGIRTAIVEELPNSKVLDIGALKRIVGTQKINSRKLYSNYKEFVNQSTVFISCNRLPMINETDEGTWRRVAIFTFPYSYKKKESEIKTEWDKVGDPKILYAARSKNSTAKAFLAWRIDGAKRWIKNNREEYDIPSHMDNRINEWNENNDLVLGWFNECVEKDAQTYITLEDLRASHNEWLAARGNAPVSQRLFIENLINHRIYTDNNIIYCRSRTPYKNYVRDVYSSDYYKPQDSGNRLSFFMNIKFKN